MRDARRPTVPDEGLDLTMPARSATALAAYIHRPIKLGEAPYAETGINGLVPCDGCWTPEQRQRVFRRRRKASRGPWVSTEPPRRRPPIPAAVVLVAGLALCEACARAIWKRA